MDGPGRRPMPGARQRVAFKGAFRVGKIAGIAIGVHYTWLVAFALVAWSLAAGYFPQAYPEWGQSAYWITGTVAALLLFLSVLVHELAHSLVARARGMPVRNITLFIFGGVSNIAGEAEAPKDEFLMSIVGPLTSLALAAVFWGIRAAVGDVDTPLAATLGYLAVINALLAGFNLVPGFPLDGGRVLRSILWSVTGSLPRATNIAAAAGQAFAWVLIGWGVFQLLAGSLIGGLWIAFIGWFLNGAAESSRGEVSLREHLRGVRVADVMDPQPETVGPEMPVEDLVRDVFLHGGRRAAPVCHAGRLAGIVALADVKEVPRELWGETRVEEVMTREPLHSVEPGTELSAALQLLAQHDIHQLPVVEGGELRGMLSRADIIRYLQLARELDLHPARRGTGLLEGRTAGV
ncbi:MAG: site-2 protease family protein [Candidatus Bipolaricaulaceae bacterium]